MIQCPSARSTLREVGGYMTSDRTPLLQKLKRLIFIIFFRGILSTCRRRRICRDPEGSGRFPEACPEAYMFVTVFIAVPEGSGRFPEACPEACFIFIYMPAGPEGSGRFPEACPEACLKTWICCIPEASGRFLEALPEGLWNIQQLD